jgi:hypothetical protein
MSVPWSEDKTKAARVCNQVLYDAVRDSIDPGAASIKLWLLYGDRLPVKILRPRTAAIP